MNSGSNGNGHSLFDAISQLFGKTPPREAAASQPSLPEIESAFNSALQQLNGKIEDLRQQQLAVTGAGPVAAKSQAEERRQRMVLAHQQILTDILAMHRKLGTGIDQPDLDVLVKFLGECVAKVNEGATLQEVMPCCRRGILLRFHREAGGTAWAELEGLMSVAGVDWPRTTQRDPFESDDVFAHRLQLKHGEAFKDFVNYDIGRSAELILGIERAWQSDYPEQGSPLWRELVLDGVATALRARILQRFYDLLVKNKEKIVARAAELVGRELGTLQAVLAEKNLGSLEDARRVAMASSRVLDEVIPEIAWQLIRDEAPGE